MARYEMKYKRWVQGLADRGEKTFRFEIEAPSEPKARAAAQAEWDRLMKAPDYARPKFLGLWKMAAWEPQSVDEAVR